MFVRKRTSEAAAKIPNARAALSPTTIIIPPATTAIRICVCATYGLRRVIERPRRGRNASSAARNAASEKRSAILAAVASQLRELAGVSRSRLVQRVRRSEGSRAGAQRAGAVTLGALGAVVTGGLGGSRKT